MYVRTYLCIYMQILCTSLTSLIWKFKKFYTIMNVTFLDLLANIQFALFVYSMKMISALVHAKYLTTLSTIFWYLIGSIYVCFIIHWNWFFCIIKREFDCCIFQFFVCCIFPKQNVFIIIILIIIIMTNRQTTETFLCQTAVCGDWWWWCSFTCDVIRNLSV